MKDAAEFLVEFHENFCMKHDLKMGEDMIDSSTIADWDDDTGICCCVGVNESFQDKAVAEKYVYALQELGEHWCVPVVDFEMPEKDENGKLIATVDRDDISDDDENDPYRFHVSWILW